MEKLRFDLNTEIIYYRVLKELTTNTIKHAKASLITVRLNVEDKFLILEYKDNGRGFDYESELSETKKGIGLLNILNRIHSINGKYEIDTRVGEGFKFKLLSII